MALTFFEGVVTTTTQEDRNSGRINAFVIDGGYQIKGIQTHIKNNSQEVLPEGSKILFYRDTAATAKMAVLLTDPPPIESPLSPLWKALGEIAASTTTAILGTGDAEPYFKPGEVMSQALGDKTVSPPTPGASLWLQNNGDAVLSSGCLSQQISVNDSTDSIDIVGANIDLANTGNIAATHGLNFDTDSLGLTSSRWGIKNPQTGVFVQSITINPTGSISIGINEPVTGLNITGIEYNALTQGVSIKSSLTSVISASISLTGLISLTGNTSIAGTFSVTAASSFGGTLSVTGASTFAGAVTTNGVLNVVGAFNALGAAGFILPPTGLLVGAVPGFTGTVVTPTSITVVNGIVTLVS